MPNQPNNTNNTKHDILKPINSTLPLEQWYLNQVDNRNLLFDANQLKILQELDIFVTQFNKIYNKYNNQFVVSKLSKISIPSILTKIFNRLIKFTHKFNHHKHYKTTHLGYYIQGSVGRGKTMIMNQLYNTIITPKKIRTHFHQFMDNIHQQIAKSHNGEYSLQDITSKLASNYKIIFLDELHVSDIATAMILNNLFTNLFNHGVHIITTSNYLPTELYKDGLMRERFLPAINLIQQNLHMLQLDTKQDYRTISYHTDIYNNHSSNIISPSKIISQNSNNNNNNNITELFIINQPLSATVAKLNQIFNNIVEQNPYNFDNNIHECIHKSNNKNNTLNTEALNNQIQADNKHPNSIIIRNRSLPFIKQSHNIIWFDFCTICGDNRSQLDYLELIQIFNWFIIQNIPHLTPDKKDIARRLTWLVDILYDSKCKLALSSNVDLDMIYPDGDFADEFKRTISRLTEMQTAKYLHSIPIGIGILAE